MAPRIEKNHFSHYNKNEKSKYQKFEKKKKQRGSKAQLCACADKSFLSPKGKK
jgi:hypothetical protein